MREPLSWFLLIHVLPNLQMSNIDSTRWEALYISNGLQEPILLTWVNFNPACISNYIHYKVWVEITYPFLIFNGATVEV